MSALDELREDDDFQAFESGIETILQSVDDPEALKQELEDGGFEDAVEMVSMDQENLQTDLEILGALARKLREQHPDTFDELQSELDDESVEV